MPQPELSSPVTVDSPGTYPAASRLVTWAWMAIACSLLVASGVARTVQDRRHSEESKYTEDCPFPLKSLPTKIGGWKVIGSGDRALDPLTMRITGGTEHLLRTYADELTGVTLVFLVLFGPAEPVMPHTPEACYPACGYSLVDQMSSHAIPVGEGQAASFRSAVYAKPNGRTTLREEVYYSFRLDGRWSPDAGAGRKFPRRNPHVFKIQIQRRFAEKERHDKDDPIEQFLAEMLPEIESRIAAGEMASRPSMGGVRPTGTAAEVNQ